MGQTSLINKYVIDTSAILDFWAVETGVAPTYDITVNKFRDLWNHIASLIKNDVVLVPKVVEKEIIFADPELKKWVNENKKRFISYKTCLPELAQIIRKYPAYTQKRLHKFNDAKIISIALNKSLAVITSEKNKKQTPSHNNPKIPEVCENFKVECFRLPEFFKEEKL